VAEVNVVFNLLAQTNAANLKSAFDQLQRQAGRGVSVPIDVGINPTATGQLSRLGSEISSVARASTSMTAAVAQMNAGIAATGRVAVDASGFIENIGSAAGLAAKRLVGMGVAAGAIYGITSVLRNTAAEAVKFEQTLNKISQISSESASEIRGIGTEVGNLATRLGVSSTSLSQTALELKQTGLSARETKEALGVLAQASLGPSFGNMVSTTQGAIAMLRQFGLTTKDTGAALGSITALSNAYATQASDLIDAVKRAGGAFKSSGGNLEEFLSLMTVVRATTQESAGSIATGLRTVFSRMERGTTVEALKDMGIELRHTREEAEALGNTDLTGRYVGSFEAIRRVSDALKNLNSQDPRYSAVAEQLGGYREISRVLPLLQQFSVAQRAMSTAQSGQVALSAAAEKAQDTLANKFEKVKETWLDLGRSLVESKGFQALANDAALLGKSLAQVVEVARPLLPMLATLGAIKIAQGIGGAVANFGSVLSAAPGTRITASPRGFARGGSVPGTGDVDSVHAMLMPGEYVLRKDAVKAIGHDTLNAWNEGRGHTAARRFASGGDVGTFSQMWPQIKEHIGSYNQSTGVNFLNGTTGIIAASSSNFDEKYPRLRGAAGLFHPLSGRVVIKDEERSLTDHLNTVTHELVHGLDLGAGLSSGKKTFANGKKSFASQLPGSPLHEMAQWYKANVIPDAVRGRFGKEYQDYRNRDEEALAWAMASHLVPNGEHNDSQDIHPAVKGLVGMRISELAYPTLRNTSRTPLAEMGSLLESSDIQAMQAKRMEPLGPLMKYAHGGQTGVDSIHALLMPGEYVMNRDAVASIGTGTLDRLNSHAGIKRFANGGPVGGPSAMSFGAVRESADPAIASLAKDIEAAAAAANKSLYHFSEVLVDVSNGVAKFAGFPGAAGPKSQQDVMQAYGLRKEAVLAQAQQNTLLNANYASVTKGVGRSPFAQMLGDESHSIIGESLAMSARTFDPSKYTNKATGLPFTAADVGSPELQRHHANYARRYANTSITRELARRNKASSLTGDDGSQADLADMRHGTDEIAAAREFADRGFSGVNGPGDRNFHLQRRPGTAMVRWSPQRVDSGVINAEVLASSTLGRGPEPKRIGFQRHYDVAPLHPAEPDIYAMDRVHGRRPTYGNIDQRLWNVGPYDDRITNNAYQDQALRSAENQRNSAEIQRKLREREARQSDPANIDPLSMPMRDRLALQPGYYENIRNRHLARTAPAASPSWSERLGRIPGDLRGVAGRFSGAVSGGLDRVNNSMLGRAASGFANPAVAFSLPYLAALSEHNAGTPEAAAHSFGGAEAYTSFKGISGGLQGAVSGGMIGASVGGPIGLAAGAVVGGIASYTSAIREAESEIRQVRIGEALTQFGDSLHQLADNAGNPSLSPSAAASARQGLATFRRQTTAESTAQATSWNGSFDASKFIAANARSTRQGMANNLPNMLQTLSKSAEDIGRNNVAGRIQDLEKVLADGGGGLNRELISLVAELRGTSQDVVMGDLRRDLVRGQRAATSDRVNRDARRADGSVSQYGRVADTFEASFEAGSPLRDRSRVLTDAFDSGMSPLHVDTGAHLLNSAGRPDAAMLGPLGMLSRLTGNDSMLRSGTALQSLSGVLPGVLSNLATRPATEGRDMVSEFREQAISGMGYNLQTLPAEHRTALDLASRNLQHHMDSNRGGSGVIDAVGSDATGFSRSLLANVGDPLKEAAGRMLAALGQLNGGFVDGTVKMRQFATTIGETQDRQAALSLQGLRTRVGFAADQAYQGGRHDLLSLDQLEAPYQFRQERLTGLRGGDAVNPDMIASLLTSLRGQVVTAEAHQTDTFQRTGGAGDEFRQAASSLTTLRDRASNAQRALEGLANVSERNAAAQERLGHLTQEREGRNEFGRRFLSAGFDERFEMQRSAQLAQGALQRGNLNGLIPEDIRSVFSFLDQTRNVTLQGPRGPITGGDASRQLVEASGFGLTGPQQTEQQQLQQTIIGRFDVAERAMQNLVSGMTTAREVFFTNLTAQHTNFFSTLTGIFARQEELASKTNEAGRVAAVGGTLREQEGQASLLKGVGITSTAGVEALNARRGDLEGFLGAAQARNRALAIGRDTAADVHAGLFGNSAGFSAGLGQASPEQVGRINDFLTRHNVNETGRQSIVEQFNRDLKAAPADAGVEGVNAHVTIERATDILRRSVQQHAGRGEAEDASAQMGRFSRPLQAIQGLNLGRVEAIAGNDQQQRGLLGSLGTFNAGNPLEGLQKKLDDNNASLNRLNDTIKKLTEQIGQAHGQQATAAAAAEPAQQNPFDAVRAALAADHARAADAGIAAPFATGGPVGTGAIGFGSASPNPNFFRASGSDVVPAMLSTNEFVINAASAQANLGLLHSINSARGPLRLADGGPIPQKDVGQLIGFEPVKPEEAEARLSIYASGDRFGPAASLLADRGARALAARQQAAARRAEGDAENPQRDALFAGMGNQRIGNFWSRVANGRDRFEAEQQDMAAGRARFMLDQAGQAHNLQMQVAAVHATARGRADMGTQMSLLGHNLAVTQSLRTGKLGNQRDLSYQTYLRRLLPTDLPGAVIGNAPQAPAPRRPFAPFVAAGVARDMANRDRQNPQVGGPNWQPPGWAELQPAFRFAQGGIVGGNPAAGDVHPALLTGGEAVLNTRATAAFGAANVLKLNRGGIVGSTSPVGLNVRGTGDQATPGNAELTIALRAFSGSVSTFGTACGTFGESTKEMAAAITIFAGSSNTLADSINKMPKEITMNARHTVDINHNGAAMFQQLVPAIKDLIMEDTKQEIQRSIKEAFPDAGLVV
jgi:TP901 family phage tail tape measure protein